MIATNHALTGVTIAILLADKPLIALPLAFFSHFALDALPHSGFDDAGGHLAASKKAFYATLALDAALLFISFLVLVLNDATWLVYACWFLAGSPDLVWAYRYVFKEKAGRIKPLPLHGLNKFHSDIQWSQTRWGWIVEIPVMIFLFYFVSNKL